MSLSRALRGRAPADPHQKMSEEDRRIIEDYAQGAEHRRAEAVAVHRRNIPAVGVRGNDHQRFMAEVDSPCPDLVLRRLYRMAICLRS